MTRHVRPRRALDDDVSRGLEVLDDVDLASDLLKAEAGTEYVAGLLDTVHVDPKPGRSATASAPVSSVCRREVSTGHFSAMCTGMRIVRDSRYG